MEFNKKFVQNIIKEENELRKRSQSKIQNRSDSKPVKKLEESKGKKCFNYI